MKRAAAAAAAAIAIWSTQDAVVWRAYFDGRAWSPAADLYQFWHQALLAALIVAAVLVVGRRALAVWTAGAIWALANSGLSDVLYYWLAGQAIPARLPWLDVTHPLVIGHPATSTTVLESSAVWLALVIAAAALVHGVELMVAGSRRVVPRRERRARAVSLSSSAR